MGSHLNFKNFGEVPTSGETGTQMGNFPLARQGSIYSLTFDQLQNTFSGLGKDFGSMNMDELLKNLWTAEETQAITSATGGGEGSTPRGNLQRQGSLTLPRTLSQKTVDEVWKDLLKETGDGKDGTFSTGGSNMQQRQQTLGEVTLEEFLLRAGVVREDAQPIGSPNDIAFYGQLLQQPSDNTGLNFGFQQANPNTGIAVNIIAENSNSIPNQPPSIALNGIRSSQQQPQGPQQQQQQQHPLFPKLTNLAFASPMNLANSAQMVNPGTRGTIVPIDTSMKTGFVQSGGLQSGVRGIASLGTGAVTVAVPSPGKQVSPDMIGKGNKDASPLSPASFGYNQGIRGRKSTPGFEKVVERRHRRMIKNRESAARSRARKQAYTVELEQEVAKLKELNDELQKKQEEIMEVKKNQIIEKMKQQWGGKRLCLRRTLTGPW